ncbi:MAG: hypothetical protein V3S67_05110 [Gammaproteobacteria bacterium]
MNSRIYDNPKFSKFRATMALLETAGVELEVVDTLQTPPSAAGIGRPPESALELFE